MSHRCACLDLVALKDKLDAEFKFKGNSLVEVRCKNYSGTGVCTSCASATWPALLEKIDWKEDKKPNDIIQGLSDLFDKHTRLQKLLPKLSIRKIELQNISEHIDTVLTQLHMSLYQNYVLCAMEEEARTMALYDEYVNGIVEDKNTMKKISKELDSRFTVLWKRHSQLASRFTAD